LAVDAALIVTVLPVGTLEGAVYTVVVPLAVWTGEKEPQFALPQATVQSTPAFVPSFATLADRFTAPLATMLAGGTDENETWIGTRFIVNIRLVEPTTLLAEVAVTETMALVGRVAGEV
jgi:hypothetical protein